MDGVDVHLARSGAIRSERLEPFATPRMAVDLPLEHGRVRTKPANRFPISLGLRRPFAPRENKASLLLWYPPHQRGKPA